VAIDFCFSNGTQLASPAVQDHVGLETDPTS
jgi:hypothetical protein